MEILENAPGITSSRKRIVVADDHPLVRTGVRLSIARNDTYEIVGEAATSQEALKLVKDHKPNIVILDLDMPGPGPAVVIPQILSLAPQAKILILSSHSDVKILKQIARFPISGYLLKHESPEDLLQALRTIDEGTPWYSKGVVETLAVLSKLKKSKIHFTPRERQVLSLIQAGHDNCFIGKELCLAVQTVRNYSTTIYEKVGATGRVETVIWACTNDWQEESTSALRPIETPLGF